MTKFTIEYEPNDSALVATASWRGTLLETMERHFACRHKDERIVKIDVDEQGITAYFVKGKRT